MHQLRRVAGLLTVLLVGVLGNLTWVQVIDADNISTQPSNTRLLLQQ